MGERVHPSACVCPAHDAETCAWVRAGQPIPFHVGDEIGERAEDEARDNPCECGCHEPDLDENGEPYGW